MNVNQKVWNLMSKIMPSQRSNGLWHLGYVLEYVMYNPGSINNLSKNVYPVIADKFHSNPASIRSSINRFLKLLDIEKLSEITGVDIEQETLTSKKLIIILTNYLKQNT